MDNNELRPEDEKKANSLCVVSLLCVFLPEILRMICFRGIYMFLGHVVQAEGILEKLSRGLDLLVVASVIAGIVLMIYVRVKYPKNVFGKVIMWLYIILAILAILMIIIMIVACTLACGYLINTCQGCGQMG